MSTLSNHPQSNVFPTETQVFQGQQNNTSFLRKGIKQQHKTMSAYSPKMYKSKNSSKQKIISPELQSIINKIQFFVDDIDNKIQNRVQLVKQVYLHEYKQQVVQMSAQLKNLRQKLDNEVMRQRANQKMFYLEQERDFFRSEVLKLNQQMNKLNVDNKSLQKLIEEEKSESQNYKKIVYILESKLLRLKNANMQRERMLQAQSTPSNAFKNKIGEFKNRKEEPNPNNKSDLKKKVASTMATGFIIGAKTQRQVQNTLNSLQAYQNAEQKQMNRTGYKMRQSHSTKSCKKLHTPPIMRSTAPISYPKLSVQRLQKIQGYSQLLQRQNVIDECINQLKKQIYYRNLSIGQKQSRVHFNETAQVRFQNFTKTDKKELIIKLLSSQKILNRFYQFLFNNRTFSASGIEAANQLINNKLDSYNQNDFSNSKLKLKDSKFNTMTLTNLKTEFNKKIFQIKYNR